MKKKLVLVVGNSRSGTSVITNLISIFNFNFGNNCHPPRNDNPKGFFEDKYFHFINEILLKKNRMLWWSLKKPLSIKFNISKFYICVFNHYLKKKNIAVIKNPRAGLFLKKWIKFLKIYELKIIFCYREPEKIIESIYKRDNLPKKIIIDSILLNWYLTLFNLDKSKIKIINYDKLNNNPNMIIKNIELFLNEKIDLKKKNFFLNSFFIKKKSQNKIFYKTSTNKNYLLLREFYNFIQTGLENKKKYLKFKKKLEKYFSSKSFNSSINYSNMFYLNHYSYYSYARYYLSIIYSYLFRIK